MKKLFNKILKKEKEYKPNIEMFNDHCTACRECGKVLLIPQHKPLSVVECPDCESPVFIPMRIRNYWLYERIGGGNSENIYKALTADGTEKRYAVKVLIRPKSNIARKQKALIHEATVGVHIGKHPHLVHVKEYGAKNGECYYVMDYIEGQPLDRLIEEGGVADQEDVLMWGLQLLDAEQHMYDLGLLYRDMEPQNLIVDKKGNIHIVDYGLCEDVKTISKDPESDAIYGELIYMPPERIVGAGESMSSEIYSIGMVMFYALTKTPYFSAEDAVEMAQRQISDVRMSSVANRLPAGVSKKMVPLLNKLTARLPVNRFHNYEEAAAAIQKVYDFVSR